MNPKFKVGDSVLINPEKLSDLDSDMRQDLADRSLSGAAYDAFYAAIVDGKPFTVAKVVLSDGVYELKLGKRAFGYQLEESDLIKAP
ncbi:MAG TPA: hypothetical protein VNU68_04465 [Verrucomicrobiae bacterium]|nr:hypothetical protein [Verrucomicrobiae bacterium]